MEKILIKRKKSNNNTCVFCRHNPIQQNKLSQALLKHICSTCRLPEIKQLWLHCNQAKKISSVSSKVLTDNCKRFCIPHQKTSSKNDLLRSLGQKLYEENIGQRKDDNEVITHENLIPVARVIWWAKLVLKCLTKEK